jgi:ABC-2 type transport system permease protein
MTQAIPISSRGHYRVQNVAKSEISKILTLRSTAITLGFTVVATLLVTVLSTHAALHHGPPYYSVGFDPTQLSLTGLLIAGLTAGVFGALLITAEYSSGTIRTTLAAVPKRPVLLTAKIGVTAVATLVFCEVLSFASFFLGKAILSSGGAPSASLSTPGALRAVLMTGVFIALLALMSFGFGLIFRSTAAAIAAFAGVVFVFPLVMHAISQSDVRYLPTNILINSVMATVNQGGGGPVAGPVSPAVGLSLMAAYSAIALAAGTALFVRRDA